jgi:hypothetical protein
MLRGRHLWAKKRITSILTTARYTHFTSHTCDQASVRIEALMRRFNIDWGGVK